MQERDLVRAFMSADGHVEIEVYPFGPDDQMRDFANEIAEAITRVFGDDVLREFREHNPADPIKH